MKPGELEIGRPLKNPKWEAFAIAYVKACGDASAAYREVYPFSARWKEESVWTRASRLLNHAKVLPRVKELQAIVSASGVASADEVAQFLTKVLRSDESLRFIVFDRTGAAVTDPKTGKPVKADVPLRMRIVAADKLNKMLGYNKPIKVDVSNSGQVPADDAAERRATEYVAAAAEEEEG